MKSFISEFKEFALRGNVMDMAIGIIIGAAFTAIVTAKGATSVSKYEVRASASSIWDWDNYSVYHDIFAGKGYAVQMEKQWAAGFMSSDPWVRTLPNCYLATCCEFGYSLCGGVYSFPAARELGRNMLKALVRTAQSAEKL